MHVLHVISGIDRPSGGPASALIGLTQAQAVQGADITVAATWHANNDLSAAEQMSSQGIQVKLIGPSRKPLARHPDIAATLQALIAKADIVHIHALWEEIQHQAAKIAHRLGVPYIIRPCGMLDPWSLAQNPLKKNLYLAWRLRKNLNRAAAIHFTSNAERDMTTPLGLTPPTIVEPNGVDFAEFHDLPPTGSFRARYQSIADRPWVMFLGRIHPGKGLEIPHPGHGAIQPR